MNVGFIATQVQARVLVDLEAAEQAYERFPEASLFWCFVDLADSSNHRLEAGPAAAYARSETFFSLCRYAVEPCSDIHVVKEIGDAVLLAAPGLRPLLESVLIVMLVTQQLQGLEGRKKYPFAVRAAIGFGPAKKLVRPHDDFLGTPIDRLSRIMNVRSETADLLLDGLAYDVGNEILGEYDEFLTCSDAKELPAHQSKAMVEPVYYRELVVATDALAEHREHFTAWRRSHRGGK